MSTSASSNKRLRLSDPSSTTPGASTSSSSTPKSFKYDVFLSFRGEDTRNNFVGHLYAALQRNGIETYKDDEKIEKGERINDQLLKSIEDTRFYIIIFSKNYASSSWCLDELLKIIECQKMTEHTAFPVLYDVEPTEVRKQYGPVGEAFSKQENKEAVEKWRDAMKELADLAGWELKKIVCGDESKLIQIIVDDIFEKLCSISLSIDGNLVGMEKRKKEVLSSLDIAANDVRMIGIKGIGGGGKTTLARAVYDHISTQFEGTCFVENVREVSKASLSGLKKLQKQILSEVFDDRNISISGVSDGKKMMIQMICRKKVLVVLDDVDHYDQLEALVGDLDYFKCGSRIIITTRDEQVLASHGVSLICNVNLLTDDEAVCLFSRYAFGKPNPTQGYNEMSRQVVRYAAGLPLTIKVLGSFLRGKNDREWKDALHRLKTIPQQETRKMLEISYDALEPDLKDIFLDIACVLKGEQKDKAIRVLESCGFHASIGLSVLEKKSLITISKYGSLGMHDRIEELGKYIDCHYLHPDEHSGHRRLWIEKEIKDTLDNNQINEAIRCIKLSPQSLDLRTFMTGLINMKKVRVIYMCSGSNWDDCRVSQRFPNSLRYISWRAYPFSSLHETFQADNLVGLDMSFSSILQHWLVEKGKALTKLRFLDLSYTSLGRMNLGLTPNLERLDLKDCWNLVEISVPFGCLKNLLYMDLSGCGITEVPKDLHHLLHLEELYLSKTKITYLPDSICMLKQLKSISLEDCHNLEKLPEDFGQLNSLEELILSNSKIKHLPNSVCMLKQLKSLKLQGCKHFERFPESFDQLECQGNLGHLESLQELDIIGTAISHLPRCMLMLKGLRIIGSKMMFESFGFTSEIQSSDNETLVNDTDGLKQETRIVDGKLVGMELSFDGLEKEYKEIFLDVACILKGWRKEDAIIVFESRGFHAEVGLRVLEQRSLITYNEKGQLWMHDHLEEMGRNVVRRSHPNEPQRHSRLWVTKEIEHILTNRLGTPATQCLYFDSWKFSAEIAIKGLSKMRDLKFLHIFVSDKCEDINWKFDKDSEYLPTTLRFMRWLRFPFSSLPNSFQGKHPVYLLLYKRKIVQLWEHGEEKVLINLRFLTIKSSKLQTFDLKLAPNLKQLIISLCYDFVELHIPANHHSKLEYLDLTHSKLTNLHLGNAPNLKTFKLQQCDVLVEFQMLAESLKLEYLDLTHSKLTNLHLENAPNLKTLILQFCHCLVEFQMPAESLKLEHLDLGYNSWLTNLHLGNTPNLKTLILEGCSNLVLLPELGRVKCLKELNIQKTGIRRLPQSIFQMKGLRIIGSTKILKSCGLASKIQFSHGITFCYI